MTPQPHASTTSAGATEFRDAMVERLVCDGMITSPDVERAFRSVPRHTFVPHGTPLDVAYSADDSVAVKHDPEGEVISSTSAPFIQARMIEQAAVAPGMTVLEIGSGGYNAALLAEVVGPAGRVISVDIDPDVTDRARAALTAAGYSDRVEVVTADAEDPIPGLDDQVDAILVTVGAWDLAPAWLATLASAGRLVVPLRMNGVSRSIAFGRRDDHLESVSAEVCGFVAMQGVGAHDDRIFRLPDPDGRHVTLRFDSGVPDDMSRLDGVLAGGRSERWSGVTVANGVSFADLHLWCAGFLPGFCRVGAEKGTALAGERGWFPFGVVHGDSFAYLDTRPVADGAGAEFGAKAYGPHGESAAAALVEQVQAWDRRARGRGEPTFTYWPHGQRQSMPPTSTRDQAVLAKAKGELVITWPS